MVGRELGLPAMASLRSIHNIEGKHSLSASLMVALVLRSGLAEYFEPISSATRKRPTRRSARAPEPGPLTHTIEMAAAGLAEGKADWQKRSSERLGPQPDRHAGRARVRRGSPAWSIRICSPASTRRKNCSKSANNWRRNDGRRSASSTCSSRSTRA
jgi:hypothetical protein